MYETLVCSRCGVEKSRDCFHNATKSKTGKVDKCKPCCTDYRREYYQSNPEKGRQQVKDWQAKNPEKVKAAWDKWAAKNPLKRMLIAAKMRAKKLGLEYTLSYRDIVIPEICPVFKVPLVWGKGTRSGNSPSIDRIDSSKGYIPNNIQIISWRANMLKSDSTPEELVILAEYMKGMNARNTTTIATCGPVRTEPTYERNLGRERNRFKETTGVSG